MTTKIDLNIPTEFNTRNSMSVLRFNPRTGRCTELRVCPVRRAESKVDFESAGLGDHQFGRNEDTQINQQLKIGNI